MTGDKKRFTCPRCGFRDTIFHQVCPECGRPFFRDYIDTQFFPRDPDPQGICKGKSWARVFLVLILIGLAFGLLLEYYVIQGW